MKWAFIIISALGILFFLFSLMNAFTSSFYIYTENAIAAYARATAINTAVMGIILSVGFAPLVGVVDKNNSKP